MNWRLVRALFLSLSLSPFASRIAGAADDSPDNAPILPEVRHSDEPPFDNNKTPLSDSDFLLLSKNGYRVQSDGTIRPPGSTRSVGKSEMQYILDELTSRQRMQAMLQLDVIFNQYGTKNLPDDALQNIREIGRQNWSILPNRVREDLRGYFSGKELEAMDTGLRPVRVPQSWLPLEAPGPYGVVDSTASDTIEAETAQKEPPPDELTPAEQALVTKLLERNSATAVSAAPSAPASGTQTAGAAAGVASPMPAFSKAQSGVAASSGTARTAADAASSPTAEHPSVSQPASIPPGVASAAPMVAALPAGIAATRGAPASAVSAPASVNPPVALPRTLPVLDADYPDVSSQNFQKFLADAPYNHDVRALLALVSDHAPSAARRLALGLVVKQLPQIEIDARFSDTEMYAKTEQIIGDPNLPAKYRIALNPGPLVFSQKHLVMGKTEVLLPAAPEFFQSAGATAPAVQAIQKDIPAKTLVTEWGLTRKFDDGSMRLLYTTEEMAGTLFEELLSLDAQTRRLDNDPYRTKLRSRFYQFAFYQKLREETGNKPVLDRALQTEFDEWINRPEDYWDFIAQSQSAPILSAVAPSLSGDSSSAMAWRDNYVLRTLEQLHLHAAASQKSGVASIDFITNPPATLENQVLSDIHALQADSAAGKDWVTEEGKFRGTFSEKK